MTRKFFIPIVMFALAGILIHSTLWQGESSAPNQMSGPPAATTEPASQPDHEFLPPPDPTTRLSGPDWQRHFFAEWHEPYGAVLPMEVQAEIWAEIARLPEEEPGRDVNSWELVGPSGMITPSDGIYSGRVLDLDALTASRPVVAAASGGLWKYNFIYLPVPVTDDVTSQWIGTVVIHPDNEDIMLIGTGEFEIHGGTGLWKSTDGGATWQHKPMSPEPSSFFRVRYGSDPSIVHAATRTGYYRSTDGGETWTRIQFSGAVTDLAVVHGNPDVLYMTRWNEGLYVSLDEGLNWYHMTNNDIPTSDVTRGAVTVCAGNPAVIYVAFAHLNENEHHVTKGIWRTTDYGNSWTGMLEGFNYMGLQGWYNNVIAVSPTDPDMLLAGGVDLMKTEQGGGQWTTINAPEVHVDYHAIQWHPDGMQVWVGHDGGWSYSSDRGRPGTWSCAGNTLPITQYVEIDAAGISWSTARVAGGSQDNGISLTFDGGQNWEHRLSADGGGIEFGMGGPEEVYFAAGVHSDGLTFHQYYSPDNCLTNIDISGGIADAGTWYPSVRIDGEGTMYTFAGNMPYSRSQTDLTWQEESSAPFDTSITELTVSPVVGQPILFACLKQHLESRLYVKDGFLWYERSDGLPPGTKVRKVVPHPSNSSWAYAIMNGLGTPGEKIFLTTNKGQSWTNITGNLPNTPLTDLIVFPDNDQHLVVGGEYGCYRTYDGGVSWVTWNNGIPRAVVVTELKTVDMRTFFQGYHVVAGTYGRSIWRREISGEDPSAVGDTPTTTILAGHLGAAPNPFNPATTLSFELTQQVPVQLEVYDVGGKLVRQLVDTTLPAARHEFVWDGRDAAGQGVASGVYLVRLQAGQEGITEKVVMTK